MIVADFVCDACEESSRYTPPFVDVALGVGKARGRERNPREQWAGVDPLFRAIMLRGIVQPPRQDGAHEIHHELHLGGCCLPLLATAEGRASLLTILTERHKLGPDASPADDGVLDPTARVIPPPLTTQ